MEEKKEAYNFTSKDAENYDLYLGPVLFEPYGQYLASQIETTGLSSVAELACGTGRVSRHVSRVLPANAKFWATDISSDMLDIAKGRTDNDKIHYRTEDIQNLSFADNSFDLVICQFGMMFLPDKQRGFNEISRILKPGGKLMCFTWDSTTHNPMFKLLINDLMLPYFEGENTDRFFVPFSLYDQQQLATWLEKAGFSTIKTETIRLNSGQATLEQIETGFYLLHPLGKAVRDKDPAAFEVLRKKFRQEIEKRYGLTVSFPMSALLTIAIK